MIFRKKIGYLANRIDVQKTARGNEIEIFDTPFAFSGIYMPLTDDTNLENYGQDIHRKLRMFVNYYEWYGKIHVGDRAYLMDQKTSEEDLPTLVEKDNEYCNNANYKVSVCEIQNLKIRIEFEKIGGEK